MKISLKSLLFFGIAIFSLIGNVVSQRRECGGTILSDSTSLTYPPPGEELIPGEICVWTVHLETTRDFRLNFTDFDVKSNNVTDCRFGAVRIYTISNLAAEGPIEGYSFCDDAPSTSFFLPNTVLVVSLFIGNSNANPGTGFTLNFDGVSYDPFRTKHHMSTSNMEEGELIFPLDNLPNYEINTAATWLVAQGLRLDFILNDLRLESCSHPTDPCACDALMLYRVLSNGVLQEVARFCGEMSDELISNTEPIFVLAFFSDFESEPINGLGFSASYYPGEFQVTTTESPSTTESHIISTECGETIPLAGTQTGSIVYKPTETYSSNERCVWIIRFRNAEGLRFDMETIGTTPIVHGRDAVIISMFTRSDPPLLRTEFIRDPTSIILNGSVAVVTFYSDSMNEGTGFILNFGVTNFVRPNISVDSVDIITSAPSGLISHPEEAEFYTHTELSMFLIGLPEYVVNDSLTNHVTWTLKGFPSGCYDYIILYKFYFDVGWSQFDLYCATSPRVTTHTDQMLYVFMSDTSSNGTGFNFEWYMD